MEMIKSCTSAKEIEDIHAEVASANDATKETNDMLDMLESALDALGNSLDLNDIKSSRVKHKMQKVMHRL